MMRVKTDQLALVFDAPPKAPRAGGVARPVPHELIPPGFVRGKLAGTIVPTFGLYAGTSMTPGSDLAACLIAGRS